MIPTLDPVALPRGAVLGAERAGARPTCSAADQPVLVTSELESKELAISTVWGCATGCGPGLEYAVRTATRCPHRSSVGCHVMLEATCVAPCREREHREHDGFECREGPEDANLHRAHEREQRGQWAAFLARASQAMDVTEAQLRPVEASPHPWGDKAMSMAETIWENADYDALVHPLSDPRLRHANLIDDSLAEPTALRTYSARRSALEKRLERLKIHAREYHARRRLNYVTADGLHAPSSLEEFDRFCLHECDRTRDLCAHYCEGGPEAACAACEQAAKTCTSQVAAFQKRRNAAHAYGDDYPNACGVPADCNDAMRNELWPWGRWGLLQCRSGTRSP